MSYYIPDEIKYKEKIVFGLDFRQLCYAGVFLALAAIVYKLPLTGTAKLILPIGIVIVGFGFVFLKFDEKILDAYQFAKGFKKSDSDEAPAQKLVGIETVNENAIHLTNGDLRAVVSVEPVNFDLLEESQQTALISNYREFLNHLTTPIQIVVRTSKPDLQDYFTQAQNKLEGASKELLACFRDFMVYEQEFLEKNHVRTRNFYVIIPQQLPYKPDKKRNPVPESLKLLEQKTKIIQEKLAACGLKTTRLENADLRTFLSTTSSQENDTNEENNLENQTQPAKPKPADKKPAKKGRKGREKRQ